MIILEKKGKIWFAAISVFVLALTVLAIIFFWPIAFLPPLIYGGAIIYLNIMYDKFVKETKKRNMYIENYAKEHKLDLQNISVEDYNKLLKGESIVLKNGIVISKEDVKYV